VVNDTNVIRPRRNKPFTRAFASTQGLLLNSRLEDNALSGESIKRDLNLVTPVDMDDVPFCAMVAPTLKRYLQ
jgi:hypothetical protein